MRILSFVLVLGVLICCEPQPRVAGKPSMDIDGLLNQQLEQLNQRRPLLNKEAGVDALKTDSTWTPTPAAWKAELDIFRSLGALNQRIHSGTYAVRTLDDPHSNLLITEYSNDEAPLKWLHVFYQEKPDHIRQVEGLMEERNPLYSAERRLTLWFDEDQGKPMLSRYEIAGYQKTSLRDTVHFRIHGSVVW